MPFSYYRSLSPSQKAIYRKSDRTPRVDLPGAEALRPLIARLHRALDHEDRDRLRRVASELVSGICRALRVSPASVRVLARRPSSASEELHGLYEIRERGAARITVWMRTARHKRVVAHKTFLRTLLHELCHHLDYTWLRLADSFHTEGFFRRESSLFAQLTAREAARERPRPERPPKSKAVPGRPRGLQLPLFLD
jgi:hypothetical protein